MVEVVKPVDYRSPELIQKILTDSEGAHPGMVNIDIARRTKLVTATLADIKRFEEFGRVRPSLETALSLKAIWDFSGLGTIKHPIDRDHPIYGRIDWVQGSDKTRLYYSAWLMRRVAQLRAEHAHDSEQTMAKVMERYSPFLIYNGSPVENQDLEEAVSEQHTIPKDKIHVVWGDIKKTVDQFQNFSLPPDLIIEKGDRIGIVAHAPHMARILRMLARFPVLPKQAIVQVFPLPTRVSGKQEYAEMEARGILYYVLLADQAAEEMYPHLLAA